MIPLRLSARDRRAVRLAALVAGPIAFWMLVAAPYTRAVSETSARLEEARGRLAHEREQVAYARGYPQAFGEGARHLLAVAPRLFGGDDNGAMSAALVDYVQRLAKASRVFVTQVEPRPTVAVEGGLASVSLEVTGESDLEGLLTLLHTLETGPKLVRLDRLEIRHRGAARMAAADVEVLSFHFTATGFRLADATRKADTVRGPAARGEGVAQ